MTCSGLIISGFPVITTEMFQPNQNTQNETEDEQTLLLSQIKWIEKLKSKLNQILSQQKINQSECRSSELYCSHQIRNSHQHFLLSQLLSLRLASLEPQPNSCHIQSLR